MYIGYFDEFGHNGAYVSRSCYSTTEIPMSPTDMEALEKKFNG